MSLEEEGDMSQHQKFTLQAKFLELDGHPLEARVDVVAEKKPSAKV